MRTDIFAVNIQVTIKGYEILAEGQFKSTIRKLPCPHNLPRGVVTEEDFVLFVVANFPNVLL